MRAAAVVAVFAVVPAGVVQSFRPSLWQWFRLAFPKLFGVTCPQLFRLGFQTSLWLVR